MAQEDTVQRATDDFQQLQLLFTDPIQFDYEVIRPIVLFAQTLAARSEQTSIDRSMVGEKARRFIQKRMLGLVDQRTTHSGRKPHTFPEGVAAYILYLKQLYPPPTIARSCGSWNASLATARIITRSSTSWRAMPVPCSSP